MRRLTALLIALFIATTCYGQAFIWTDIDLEKRGEQSTYLTATQNDNNLTKIETSVNNIGLAVETATTLGEMYITDNAVVTTVAVADTWYKVENFTSGELEGVTFASDSLVLPSAIWYTTSSMSFSGTTGNIVQFAFGIDGTIDTMHLMERKFSSSDVGTGALVGYITVTEGQSLGLYVKNLTAANDVLVKHATVISNRILK